MHRYRFRKITSIKFRGKKSTADIDVAVLKKALEFLDETIGKLGEVAPELFGILGMRNLSALVGEMFGKALEKASKGFLLKNPHQDGYPDLLVMTDEGKELLKTLEKNMQDKRPFSDFASGGLEIKATCGSVPTPAISAKRGLKKPEMGDQRIDVMTGYDWKAHHRLTNNLVGIVWDFIDGKPVIVAVFFSSNLKQADWGAIVHPKEGGGRTTSVSIMTRDGIRKMYDGWVVVLDDQRYVDFFNRFNRASSIA